MRKRKIAGFSMIELLISIGIFIVITAIALASFRGGTVKGELKLARDEFVNDIRDVRTMALAGEMVQTCVHDTTGSQEKLCPSGGGCSVNNSCVNAVPSGGYGFYVEECNSPPCSYYLFADVDHDDYYSYSGGQLELLENGQKSFSSSDVMISELRVYTNTGHDIQINERMNVVFNPYDSDMGISAGNMNNANNGNININGSPLDAIFRLRVVLESVKTGDKISFIINSGSGTIVEGNNN